MAGSNSRTNKEKKELDLILAQLKKSYNEEASIDEKAEEASGAETDPEFSEILGKFFANESPSIESTVDDKSIDGEIAEEEIIEEDSSEIGNAFFDRSEVENQSEDDVDNVLHLMFSNTPSATDNEDYEIYESGVNEITEVENTVSLAEDDSIPEISLTEFEDKSVNTDICDEEIFEDPISIDYEALDNTDDDPITADIDESAENDADYFSVEDEEYALDEEISTFDEIDEIIADNEIPSPKPRIILDPELYTFDPLQNTLPDLISVQEEITIPDTLLHSTSNNAWGVNETVNSEKSEHLNENDISLLLKFGYDKEVKAKIGDEKAQKVISGKVSSFSPESHKIPYGFCGTEFSDKSQTKQIKDKYKSDKNLLIVQIAIIALLSIAMLTVEIFFEFLSDRTSYLVVNAVELLLIAISAAVLNKKLISGILGIVRFEANLYSILAYLIFAYATCNIATALVYLIRYPNVDPSGFMVFGLPIMLYIILVLISELINCLRESAGFDLLSRSNRFFTAERHSGDSSAHISSSFKTNRSLNSFRITQTSFITDYFKKISKNISGNVNLIYIIGIVPISSLIIGCTSALISKSVMQGIFSMMTTTFLCIPFAYVIMSPVIEYIYSTEFRKRRIALIGNDTAERLAKTESLFFDDTNAVEIISYTEIHPTKNADGAKAIEIAQRVFTSLDGPIGEFVKARLSDTIPEHSEKSEVIINSISDNGIDIYFDSSTNIIFGDKNYLQARGIKVKTDSNLNTAIKGFDRSVVYMAFDGVPKLGFIITSKIHPEFSKIAAMLDENSIKVYVDTYEPELNDLYFEQNKSTESFSVSVCKSEEYESTDYKPACDGSVICASDSATLAKAILDCREIVARRKKNSRILLGLIISGMLCSILFTVLLSIDREMTVFNTLRSHSSLIFNVIMLLHMIPCIISISKIRENQKSKEINSKEKK